MKRLKHDTHVAAAEEGQCILAQSVEFGAGNHNSAGADPLQSGRHRKHGRLSGTRRPGDADGFSRGNGEIDPAQDVDRTRSTFQSEMHTFQDNHRFRRRGWTIGGDGFGHVQAVSNGRDGGT